MKFPSPLLVAGAAACALLGVVVLGVAVVNLGANGELRGKQLSLEQQRQSLEALEARVEAEEDARASGEEKIENLRTSLQAQQGEIEKRQEELKKQEEVIGIGTQIQQKVGPALLQDMAMVSLKNEQMKALLSKHGYNVTPPGGK